MQFYTADFDFPIAFEQPPAQAKVHPASRLRTATASPALPADLLQRRVPLEAPLTYMHDRSLAGSPAFFDDGPVIAISRLNSPAPPPVFDPRRDDFEFDLENIPLPNLPSHENPASVALLDDRFLSGVMIAPCRSPNTVAAASVFYAAARNGATSFAPLFNTAHVPEATPEMQAKRLAAEATMTALLRDDTVPLHNRVFAAHGVLELAGQSFLRARSELTDAAISAVLRQYRESGGSAERTVRV